jgi:hypothetical protein
MEGEAEPGERPDSRLVSLVGPRIHAAGRQIVIRLAEDEASPVGPCPLFHRTLLFSARSRARNDDYG